MEDNPSLLAIITTLIERIPVVLKPWKRSLKMAILRDHPLEDFTMKEKAEIHSINI